MKKSILTGVMVLLGGANAIVEAGDKIINFSLVSSGSFVSTPIDTNLDGSSASLTTMKGRSKNHA